MRPDCALGFFRFELEFDFSRARSELDFFMNVFVLWMPCLFKTVDFLVDLASLAASNDGCTFIKFLLLPAFLPFTWWPLLLGLLATSILLYILLSHYFM